MAGLATIRSESLLSLLIIYLMRELLCRAKPLKRPGKRDEREALSRNAAATQAVLDVMARLRDPRARLSVGRRAELRDHRARTRSRKPTRSPTRSQRNDLPALKEELGDLLFQVAFHARMAEEQGAFDFADVANALADKMIERHPHVFGDRDERTAEEQTRAWETLKAEKRAAQGRLAARRRRHGPPRAHARREAHQARGAHQFRLADAGRGAGEARRGTGRARTKRAARDDHEALTEEMGDILFVHGQPRPQARTSIPKKRCAAPTPSSPAASSTSNAASPNKAAPAPSRSTTWKRCGWRRSARKRSDDKRALEIRHVAPVRERCVSRRPAEARKSSTARVAHASLLKRDGGSP